MQSHPTHVLLLAVCKLAVDPLQRHLFDRELEVSFGLLFFYHGRSKLTTFEPDAMADAGSSLCTCAKSQEGCDGG